MCLPEFIQYREGELRGCAFNRRILSCVFPQDIVDDVDERSADLYRVGRACKIAEDRVLCVGTPGKFRRRFLISDAAETLDGKRWRNSAQRTGAVEVSRHDVDHSFTPERQRGFGRVERGNRNSDDVGSGGPAPVFQRSANAGHGD